MESITDIEHQRDTLQFRLEETEHQRDRLESQLHAISSDSVELLKFANLAEPYLSHAHCHGNSDLDRKLYQACIDVRKVITRSVSAYLKGELK